MRYHSADTLCILIKAADMIAKVVVRVGSYAVLGMHACRQKEQCQTSGWLVVGRVLCHTWLVSI